MIEISDVRKVYRMGELELAVLRGIDLEVNDGEMVAIMGPSGSGKSTLMNILGCLDKASSGSYKLDGMEITRLSDGKLAHIRNIKIGFIFQSYNLLSHLNALENVELPLVYRGTFNRKLALESLEKVGLKDRIHHKPTELSGGQQQRVSIARVLTQRSSIILADEPTGALDTHSSKEILNLLTELNQSEKITTIIVTHDPSVAACTRRIIRIEDGLVTSDEPVNNGQEN
jgi:putative ABC transport system ATP-binding protein